MIIENIIKCEGKVVNIEEEDDYYMANKDVKILIQQDQKTYYIDKGIEIFEDYQLHYHRIGGPAWFDLTDGEIGWWVEDMHYEGVQEYCEACGFDGETTLIWILKYGNFLPVFFENIT